MRMGENSVGRERLGQEIEKQKMLNQEKMIAAFDEALAKKLEYPRMLSRMLQYFVFFIGSLLFLVPFELKDTHLYVINALSPFFLTMMQIGGMTGFYENQKAVSIFKKLKYTPVNMEILMKDRLKKAFLFVTKMMGYFTVLHMLSSLLFKSFSIVNLLYFLFLGCALLFWSFLEIYFSYRAGKA